MNPDNLIIMIDELLDVYGGSLADVAEVTELSTNTLRRALAGKPVRQSTVDKIKREYEEEFLSDPYEFDPYELSHLMD